MYTYYMFEYENQLNTQSIRHVVKSLAVKHNAGDDLGFWVSEGGGSCAELISDRTPDLMSDFQTIGR